MKKFPIYLGLVTVSLLLMFPFYWLVVSSLKSVPGMNLVPPTLYPAERLVQTVMGTLPFCSVDGKTWVELAASLDVLSPSQDKGRYLLKVDDGRPTQLVKWYSDATIPGVIPKTIDFKDLPVEDVQGERRIVLAKLVRQSEHGFNEVLFSVPANGDLKTIRVDKDQHHSEIRKTSVHWENYSKALAGPEASIGGKSAGFLLFMRNSLFISMIAVIGQVVSSSLVAFGFARTRFKGREFLFVILLATLMVPGQVTLIPLFYLYKSIGWVDSFLPLTIPQFAGGAFNVFLIRQFMLGLPKELDESATLDGANLWTVFWKVIFPNCRPVLIVVGLFTFVHSWQDVLGPLIYLDNPDFRTAALGLEYFRSPYVDNRPLLMAGALLSMLPVAILFLFAQRYIMSGIATTGLKG